MSVKWTTPAYEGNMPYAFISYAHKDSNRIFPILEQLSAQGCRIWYDAGIQVGDEWPEVIASHLACATTVVVFVSNNSLMSQNCSREIHFAISRAKALLIIYLEDVLLTYGMEMQLGVGQALFYHKTEPNIFFSSLLRAKCLQQCFSQEIKTENNSFQNLHIPQTVAPISSIDGERQFRARNKVYQNHLMKYCESEAHVVIPNGIIDILPWAFRDSTTTKFISIPSSVECIRDHAFFGCSNLTTVEISKGVREIGNSAFYECVSLENIYIPDSITFIGDAAFGYCSNLSSITIPKSVKHLGFLAFSGCDNLKIINAPYHLESAIKKSAAPENCKIRYF